MRTNEAGGATVGYGMDWLTDGRDWPNREASRFVDVRGTRWHLQQMGDGPELLLLHGTGATTHSFRELLPSLAGDFRVVAVDLPGHGFSARLADGRPSLDHVSSGLAALLQDQDIRPVFAAGHSAGAAIAVNMTATGLMQPRVLAAINGAFYPFPGFAGHLFPAAARLLFLNPLAPRLFAFGAGSRRRVIELIRSTGSTLSQEGIDLYQRALMSSRHIEGTLAMMANWDLELLEDRLRSLEVPFLQIVGGRDGTIAPSAARKTAVMLKHGRLRVLENYGHLVHEEAPGEVAALIRAFAIENHALDA